MKYKYNKITYHESSIKIKLEPGDYDFIVMNSVEEYASQDDLMKKAIAEKFYPKCLELQIRVKIFTLNTERLKNWECNDVFFDILPKRYNNIRDLGIKDNIKNGFSYYSNNVLIPKKNEVVYLRTNEAGVFRLNIEQPTELKLKVTLMKKDKVLKTAKSFKEGLYNSLPEYITYYLKANEDYEIHFEHVTKITTSIYYEHCNTFVLNIEFVSKTNLDILSRESCPEHIPTVENVIIERMVGVQNSYYKYGTRTILQMFTYKNIVSNNSTEIENTEKIHPKSNNMF